MSKRKTAEDILRRADGLKVLKTGSIAYMVALGAVEDALQLAAPAPTGESLSMPEVKEAILNICEVVVRELDTDAAEQSGARYAERMISEYFSAKESA